jgi:hypothetical protein
MTHVRVAPSWLALREPADLSSHADGLMAEVRRALPGGRPLIVHDLAGGTGNMMRRLALQLPGPQHWVVHDVDPDLLARIGSSGLAAQDGSPVTFETRCGDVTRLTADALADADLITCSALLDLLTASELERLVHAVESVGCVVLVTTTVSGVVDLRPKHGLDASLTAAFNAHQRRTVADRALLGPDAADAAAREFSALGRTVVKHPSPWTLDATVPELTRAWLDGWLDAAREQEPWLCSGLDDYVEQRHAELAAGRLHVRVEHCDLFVQGRDVMNPRVIDPVPVSRRPDDGGAHR